MSSAPVTTLVHRALLVAAALSVAGGAACPPPVEDLEPLELEEGCQPLLAGADCMLPYPSDYFVKGDAALPSGRRVEITDVAKLITDEGYSADTADFRPYDGFSTSPPIVAILGEPMSDDGLVGIFDDPSPTERAGSPTVILEAETGRFIPHFTDLDPRATDPARQALILRPLVPLEEQTRYVVALQNVVTPGGAKAAAPEGFRRLRDDVAAQDPELVVLAGRYESEVFAPLVDAGLDRAGLQLAWDFTTGSDAHATADMWRVRELTLEWLANNTPAVTIGSVIEDAEDERWRVVFGSITGPLFTESNSAGSVLHRGADGRVAMNGTAPFTFRAVVPSALKDAFEPGQIMVFGHGFFGSAAGASSGEYSHQLLEDQRAVAVMTDWAGMSEADIGELISTVGGEVWLALRFGDRVHQGVANQLVLLETARTVLSGVEGLVRPSDPGAPGVVEDPANPGQTNAGQPLFDPARLSYYGISNGHILGGVLMAVEPKLERWVLQVGGASFSQMMFRALPFGRFLVLLDIRVPDPLDQQKLAAHFQPQFDRFDPARFAPYVNGKTIPVGPVDERDDLRFLLQAGVGDTSVPNFASFLHARMLGASHLVPSPRDIWGLPEVTESEEPTRAFTLYDFGISDDFYELAIPPEDSNPVHESVRRSDAARTQIGAFLSTGEIMHPCDGACVVPVPDGA